MIRSIIEITLLAFVAQAQLNLKPQTTHREVFYPVRRPMLPISGPQSPVFHHSLPSHSLYSSPFQKANSQYSASVSVSASNSPLPSPTMPHPSSPDTSTTIQEPLDTITLYRISGDECSQSTVQKNYGAVAARLLKVNKGTCASQGFTEIGSTDTIMVPLAGEITVSFFKKPDSAPDDSLPSAGSQDSANTATLYKISKKECGQVTIDRGYAMLAVHFANLKKGPCASQGFTEVDGKTQTVTLPVLGKTEVKYFKKSDSPPKGFLRPFRLKVKTLSAAVSTGVAAAEKVLGSSKASPQMLLIQTFPDSIGIFALALIGLFIGSGMTFAMLRFRHHVWTACKDPLLVDST